MKKQLLLSLLSVGLQLSACAATQEECGAEVLLMLQAPVLKKMSALQRKDIESTGNDLCYNRSKYEAQRESLVKLTGLAEEMVNLNSSFCGSNPDLIGRGVACRKAKGEEDAQNIELSTKANELKKGEKKIRKLEVRYEKLRTSKPLASNSVELSSASRKAATIAKVKADILEAMKDPDSATFRRLTSSPDASIVCGEVNAKNSMGGYVGYRKFINIGVGWDDYTIFEESGESAFAELCDKQTVKQ